MHRSGSDCGGLRHDNITAATPQTLVQNVVNAQIIGPRHASTNGDVHDNTAKSNMCIHLLLGAYCNPKLYRRQVDKQTDGHRHTDTQKQTHVIGYMYIILRVNDVVLPQYFTSPFPPPPRPCRKLDKGLCVSSASGSRERSWKIFPLPP